MTETDVLSTDATTDSSGAAAPERRRRGGVSGMVLAELRDLATSLGVSDTTGMRRNDLISEIKKRQSGSGDQLPLGDGAATTGSDTGAEGSPEPAEAPAASPDTGAADGPADGAPARRRGGRRRATAASGPPPAPTTEEVTGAPTGTEADAGPAPAEVTAAT
ncbi:MAG TPA: Rho termination factor N-terminal domain-containing protein, partial [Actinomycetospora sp.]|nr:Rho termination factor N-terminal domain-containing protein [Actinomycetospora sp.]